MPRPRTCLRPIALVTALFAFAACHRRTTDDAPAPTMIPSPSVGTTEMSTVGLGGVSGSSTAGACRRYALCCEQLFAQVPGGGGSNPHEMCERLSSTMSTAPNGDTMCDSAMHQLATSMTSTSGISVPAICRGNSNAFFGGSGLGGSVARRGGAPGAVLPIAIGMTVNGELQTGDTVQTDGALGDEYRIYLTAGSSVTIVARGGAARPPMTGNLDMWLELLQNGSELTHDDDSAGSLNSRIVYTAVTSGIYTIRVRTFSSGAKEGSYTLQTYAGALYSQT